MEKVKQGFPRLSEDQAYDGFVSALLSLEDKRQEQRRRSGDEDGRNSLRQVTLDIERTERLPKGSIFGLHKLENTENLFIRYTDERSPFIQEMKRRFEILNSDGERVLFAVEETGYLINAFSYSSLHDFDYSFVDPGTGLEAFSVSSRARFFGIRGTEMRVSKDGLLMGRVIQTGSYGSVKFKILSCSGMVKYCIKPDEDYVEGVRPSFFQRLRAQVDIDLEFPEDFTIFSADKSIIVGQIMGTWFGKNTYGSEAHHFSSDESDDDLNEESSEEDNLSSTEDSDVSEDSGEFSINSPFPSKATTMRRKSKSANKSGKALSGTVQAEESSVIPVRRSLFNQERYDRFVHAIETNIANWKWYYEGEQFGVQFTTQLGPVSRAMLVAVLLLQYFRIHYDRHHRRTGSRILFRRSFRRWYIFALCMFLVALAVIWMDIYREIAA